MGQHDMISLGLLIEGSEVCASYEVVVGRTDNVSTLSSFTMAEEA